MTKGIVVFGYGQRGSIYASYAREFPEQFCLKAIIENDPKRMEKARQDCPGVPVYSDYHAFLGDSVEADLVAVATQDRQHREHAVAMLDAGYHLLLEKPISVNREDCLAIYEASVRNRRKVIVCYVLRYSPFYSAVKRIVDSGDLGEIITIHASENVGYFHQAHSFVRGPWRNKEQSGPMILSKCCHDMDILRWLIGEKCVAVDSFGGLSYFKEENAPEHSAAYCSDCPLEDCPFRAQKLYTDPDPNVSQFNKYFCARERSEENVLEDLRHSQYDRCVFRSDNNVVDHQVTIMQFENGKTACHTMTAFSQEIYRDIKIYGTKAELYGHMEHNLIEIRPFGKETRVIRPEMPNSTVGGHCGGDYCMMRNIYKELCGEKAEGIAGLDVSIDSHLMAFAAEKARQTGERTAVWQEDAGETNSDEGNHI